ncbi:MAG: acetate--CoA ligase family protein [Phycisphaerae bacterium]|nr:acetate--CoA ligase family protein [Phycisphaerae bacterium]
MARLAEHQGKALLRDAGIPVPKGGVARSPEEAAKVATRIGFPCMVKIQAWATGRAAMGGVAVAKTAEEARDHAARMLAMKVGQFPVTEVLIEERLAFARELFVSFSIDDRERAPILLLSASGGSGVEERAAAVRRIACDVDTGPDTIVLDTAIESLGLAPAAASSVRSLVVKLFDVARRHEARSLEINPLALTQDGVAIALDCRVTVDDYAVFRHPDLGIDIARELDHPPTALERVAYAVEQSDHRGTFYFAQLAVCAADGSRGLIGFHGAGGGGSMMSMDAVSAEGFTLADFTDTSGNPSPAKVYAAARLILAQPDLVGYFGSGSGVASQEQFWSAYGLAKAFWELELSIPAVIRLGGNTEDRAVEILQSATRGLPAIVEGYRKTDPPARIAARFTALVAQSKAGPWRPRHPRRPEFVGRGESISWPLRSGTLWIDRAAWSRNGPAIAARSNGLLRDDHGAPTRTLPDADFAQKDSDMIACEVECRRDGIDGLFVEIDIPNLAPLVAPYVAAERGCDGRCHDCPCRGGGRHKGAHADHHQEEDRGGAS